nr:MAG TPA: hypothetical protein [Bacteriophage sp.]
MSCNYIPYITFLITFSRKSVISIFSALVIKSCSYRSFQIIYKSF